ncbi:MAG: hypothetical protein AB2L14_11950 [Candidatus Xenobiia bacterium LiM19]
MTRIYKRLLLRTINEGGALCHKAVIGLIKCLGTYNRFPGFSRVL